MREFGQAQAEPSLNACKRGHGQSHAANVVRMHGDVWVGRSFLTPGFMHHQSIAGIKEKYKVIELNHDRTKAKEQLFQGAKMNKGDQNGCLTRYPIFVMMGRTAFRLLFTFIIINYVRAE